MNHDHTDHRAIPPAGSDPYDRFAADPFAPTTPAPPVGQPAPTAQPVRHRWWMHLLMCAPMLAVVGFLVDTCLLYTSDAADDLLSVDLGGRRLI